MQTSRKLLKVVICKQTVHDSHKALLSGSLKYIKIEVHSNYHVWLCSLLWLSCPLFPNISALPDLSFMCFNRLLQLKDLSKSG